MSTLLLLLTEIIYCDMKKLRNFKKLEKNNQFISFYLENNDMKKINIDQNIWDAYFRVRDLKTKEGTVNLSEATKFINSVLPIGSESYTEAEMNTLLKKNILRHERIVSGTDSLGRERATFEINQSDVERFADLIKIASLFEEIGVTKQTVHPETGEKINILYLPMTNYRKKISEIQTKASGALEILKSPFVRDLIKELDKTNDN